MKRRLKSLLQILQENPGHGFQNNTGCLHCYGMVIHPCDLFRLGKQVNSSDFPEELFEPLPEKKRAYAYWDYSHNPRVLRHVEEENEIVVSSPRYERAPLFDLIAHSEEL